MGNWTASGVGSFSVLPAGTDRYTLVFRDASRPRLTLNASGLSYTASGSQTNAAAQEIVDYSLSGSFSLTSLKGTLRIIKRRTGSGAVFSTQSLPIMALKQRHDTASIQD